MAVVTGEDPLARQAHWPRAFLFRFAFRDRYKKSVMNSCKQGKKSVFAIIENGKKSVS